MALIIQKYGGTSVGTIERIRMVAQNITDYSNQGYRLVVVLSAMSGETDRLIGLAQEISAQPVAREYDVLVSTGEQVSIALLSMALINIGEKALSYTGLQAGILTDEIHKKARIKQIDTDKIQRALDTGYIVVVAGFQGVDGQGEITTLGRGGSDTTAVALAAALKADECQIYTDVDGVYTTDPRVVPQARRLPRITFEEMLEMASLGSKVLQIRAVEFAGKYNVPLRILSSFKKGEGTLISYEDLAVEQAKIAGIAFNQDEAKLTVTGIADQPGIAYRVLGPIADRGLEVDMIVQNIGQDETTDLTFTVHRNDYDEAMSILKATAKHLGARDVIGDVQIVKLSVVGVGMRSHAGIASDMFKVMADENINIQMISTSEIKISVVIDEKYLELAVRVLHEKFGLENDLPKS